jgi:hypothetical protein
MALDPEVFRGMTPSQMLATLLTDEVQDRHTQARAKGASCVRCMDTGMEGGRFCGCSAGGKLGFQSQSR